MVKAVITGDVTLVGSEWVRPEECSSAPELGAHAVDASAFVGGGGVHQAKGASDPTWSPVSWRRPVLALGSVELWS